MISPRYILLVASVFAVLGSSAQTTAVESLDKMDTRRPLPLLPMMANHQKLNMRDHLLAVQEIIAALAPETLAMAGQL